MKALEAYGQALPIYQVLGDRTGEGTILSRIGEAINSLQFGEFLVRSRPSGLGVFSLLGEGSIVGNELSHGGEGSVIRESTTQNSQPTQRRVPLPDAPASSFSVNPSLHPTNSEEENPQPSATHEEDIGLKTILQVLQEFIQGGGTVLGNPEVSTLNLDQQDEQALVFYRQALVIQQDTANVSEQANTLNNIGSAELNLGRYPQALEAYQAALEIYQHSGTPRGKVMAFNNVGEAYRYQSQFSKAIASYQAALDLLQQMGNSQMIRADESAVLNNLGLVHNEVGDYNTALTFYQQSLTIRKQLNDLTGQGSTLLNIGLAYDQLNQNDRALEFYQRSLNIRNQVGDYSGKARTLNNMGLVYDKLGQSTKALETLNTALTIFRVLGDRPNEGNTLDSLGTVYKSLKQYDKAEHSYQQALEILTPLGNRELEGIVLTNLGDLYEQAGNKEQAITLYKRAIDEVIEKVLAELQGEELQASFSGKHVDTYSRLINLLWGQKRYQEAFDYVERAKARAFINQMASSSIDFHQGSAENLLTQEQSLRREINTLNSQISALSSRDRSQGNSNTIARITGELKEAQNKYAALLQQLRRQNPKAADLVSVTPASLQEIQQLIDGDTTLVEYFVMGDRTLAFLITRDTFTPIALNTSRQPLTESIQSLYEYDFATLKDNHPRSLKQLYQWLIQPIRSQITTKKLQIVPHNILHYVPFAALTNGDRYLVDEYVLSNLPSANVMRFLGTPPHTATPRLLAIGNPTFDLPFTQQEVSEVSTLYGAQPLLGSKATEASLWSQASQANILHLATHGEYNPISPLFSTLYFVPSGNYDGRLEVHEIYDLKLPLMNLVVLSACQTQVGRLSRGDEIVGLSRAFLYAGTPSIMASLWNVDDQATGMLMEQFYTYLRQNVDKATALQQAQRDVRAKYPHPYYWSAFVLTGRTEN